jgi:hypothetical protein
VPDLSHWGTTTPDAPAVVSAAGDRTFAELDGKLYKRRLRETFRQVSDMRT